MPSKKHNNIPNSNNLFAIFQAQVESSALLVKVIVNSGIDKNLVKTITSASKAIDTAVDTIYKSLDKMNSYDIGKSAEASKTLASTTQAFDTLVTVISNINKINGAQIRMAKHSVNRLMDLMFGDSGKNPKGVIPMLEKIGDKDKAKSLIDGTKILKQVAPTTNDLTKMAVVLGASLPVVTLAVLAVKVLSLVVDNIITIYSNASSKEQQIIQSAVAFKQMSSSLLLIIGSISLISLSFPFVMLSLIAVVALKFAINGILNIYSMIASNEKDINTASKVIGQMALSLLTIVGSVTLISLASPFVMLSMITIVALKFAINGIVNVYSMIAENVSNIGAASNVINQLTSSLLTIVGGISLISLATPFVMVSMITVVALSLVIKGLIHIYSNVANKEGDISTASKVLKQMASSLLIIVGSISLIALATPLVTISILTVFTLSLVIKGLLRIYSVVVDKQKDINTASKTFNQMSVSLLLFVGSLVIIGLTFMIAAPLIAVAMVATLAIVGLMVLMSVLSKNVKEGGKVLKDMALAMLILSATALLMAVTGQFIVANWESMLIVSAYLLVLVGSCLLLALAKKIINEGTRELLYLALAIAILAGTAMLMAVVGQFIMANWENMLIMSTYLLVLVGSCLLLSLAKKWIESGAKELLFIALAVAILAGVAMLIVYVGNLLTVNWEPVLTVTLLLTVLVGATYLIARASKTIQKGWVAMLIVVLFAAAMASVVYILAEISNTADPLKLLEVVGVMALIMVAVGGIAVAAGALQEQIMQGVTAVAVISGISLVMSIVIKNLAKAASIAPPLEILEATGIMALIMAAVGAMTIASGALLAGPQAIVFGLGVAAMGTLSMVALLLTEVVKNTAKAATAVRSAGLKDPDEVAAIISLPIKAFTKGNKDNKSLFGCIADLPNPASMTLYTNKVKSLTKITVSIGRIADILQHIASLNMPDPTKGFTEDGRPKGYMSMTSADFRSAAQNVGSILTFFTSLFDNKETEFIFGGDPVTVKPLNTQALENISRGAKKKIARLGEIVAVVGGMAETLKNMSSLIVPDAMNPEDFNENGTPKKWRKMATTDISNAALTAGSMLEFFCALFGEQSTTLSLGSLGGVTINPISESALDNISRGTKKKMERLGEIIAVVGGLGETLKNLSGLIVPDANGPEDFNENGTPKKWRKMTQQDFDQAMAVAEMMLTSVVNILGNEQMQNKLSSISKRNAKKLDIAMQAVNGLGNIMELVKALAGGRMATKWEKDNDPNSPTYGQQVAVEYINLTEYLDKNQDKITSTVYDLIMCPINAIASIVDNKSAMDSVEKANEYGSKITGVLINIKQPITDIIDLYNDKLSGVNVDSIRPAFEGVMLGVISPLADLDPDRVELVKKGSLVVFERIAASLTNASKIPDNSAKNFQNNVKETVGLLKTVDSVNLDKLKTASDLMKHIEGLSKSINGNFKELAHAINEDLLEALEKLTGALDDVSNKDIKVAAAGDVISKPSGSAGVAEKKEPQQPAGNQLTKSDLDNIIRAINELTSKFSRVITSDSKVQVKM